MVEEKSPSLVAVARVTIRVAMERVVDEVRRGSEDLCAPGD